MATATHKFQAPKGTRDFYPSDMIVRRYIESVWREVSINHGFDEIDGPTFEHLELYTVKSGPGIVNELFTFKRAGGDTDYALRPEFTPTLARMVAAKAAQLPRPIKWFCMSPMFRAERPQRGRLREHYQWNVDIVGDETLRADAEAIAVSIALLERFGITPEMVRVRISHRTVISTILTSAGFSESELPAVFDLLDRRDKMPREALLARAGEMGLETSRLEQFSGLLETDVLGIDDVHKLAEQFGVSEDAIGPLLELADRLRALGLSDWVRFDIGIVRGLAYYTGSVFELHEVSGSERAVAGGGRYDQLVSLFGGPAMPAVGVAMGDVVIRLILEDRGLLGPALDAAPRPDAFIINARDDDDQLHLVPLVRRLRQAGLHIRHSYKATKNVGKLLGDAGKARSRFSVILGAELDDGRVVLKDLDGGTQQEVSLDELAAMLQA